MTSDDAFDARLRAAFERAEPDFDQEEFAKRVLSRLGRSNRSRALVIGGAGSTGSAIAATQLEHLFESSPLQDTVGEKVVGSAPEFAALMTVASPEVLAAVALALMIGAVAWMIPSRN